MQAADTGQYRIEGNICSRSSDEERTTAITVDNDGSFQFVPLLSVSFQSRRSKTVTQFTPGYSIQVILANP